MKNVFSGVATALVTPFSEDGRIDFPCFENLVRRQISAGIETFVIGATTGEGAVLSVEEKAQLTLSAFSAGEKEGKKLTLISGISSNNPVLTEKQCLELSKLPLSAFLVTTPFYNKTSQSGLIKIYEKLADLSIKPIIIYNVPKRTGMNVTPETYGVLSKHPNICGIKEADEDMVKFTDTAVKAKNLPVYSGSDELALPMAVLGAKGWISVVSNIFPEKCVALYESFEAGNLVKARELHEELYPAIRLAFSEVNPIPVKAMAEFFGLSGDFVRPPLCTLTENEKNALYKKIESLGYKRETRKETSVLRGNQTLKGESQNEYRCSGR